MSLTACSDFLDKEPLSQEQRLLCLRLEHFAANALYNVIDENLIISLSYGDRMDRGTDISGLEAMEVGGSALKEIELG